MPDHDDRIARRTRIRAAKGAIHHARTAFEAGEYQASRFWFLSASGWFAQAGAAPLSRRAAGIGEKVAAFQMAGGLPVNAARRPPATRGRIVSVVR